MNPFLHALIFSLLVSLFFGIIIPRCTPSLIFLVDIFFFQHSRLSIFSYIFFSILGIWFFPFRYPNVSMVFLFLDIPNSYKSICYHSFILLWLTSLVFSFLDIVIPWYSYQSSFFTPRYRHYLIFFLWVDGYFHSSSVGTLQLVDITNFR